MDLVSELEALREAQQVLDYAQSVGQHLPDVDSARLAELGDEIQSRYSRQRSNRDGFRRRVTTGLGRVS